MFCSWERLSQRVCNIQIHMYLANLYFSFRHLMTDQIEASLVCLVLLWNLDSFAKAIAPVLLQKIFIGPDALGITPRSDMNSFIQTPSFDAFEAAMYSASHVDPATTLCLELHQLTALLQDAANATLRSETLRRNCVRCNNRKRWCKKTSKRIQKGCDGRDNKHVLGYSCVCDVRHTVHSNEPFAMSLTTELGSHMKVCAIYGMWFTRMNCLRWDKRTETVR